MSDHPVRTAARQIAQAKAAHDQRVRSFLAAGGQCAECFDLGTMPWPDAHGHPEACPHCARGQAIQEQRRRSRVNDFLRAAGTAGFPHLLDDHPNRKLVNFLLGWAGQRTLAARDQPDPAPFLILYGAYGVGKSGLAAALLRILITDRDEPGIFVPVPEMIDLLRPGDDQDPALFEAARDRPLVVLDDLGVTPLTAFVEERLYIVVDRRYRKRLPTIITTNKDPGELAGKASLVATVGERIYWRLIERSERVYCGGADKNLRRH